jgi:hypothetical protein
MTTPVAFLATGNRPSEIPCRVGELPLERAISPANRLITGKPHSHEKGNPVGSRERKLFDPVTTEAKAEMACVPKGKTRHAITRRPSRSHVHIPSYVSGYVDGEGCFCVSLRPQPRIRVGWEVRPSFSVSQNGDRSELISLLPEFFGCGCIRPDRSDRTVKFEVRSLNDLVVKVIPFFDQFPILSAKRRDYEIFKDVCRIMVKGHHLQRDGLLEIADLATTMNGGRRRYTRDMIEQLCEVKR